MFKNLRDYQITNSKVLVRVDYNVPVVNTTISNTTRIDYTLDTINYLLQNNNTVILISHFGRPDGKIKKELSLKLVYEYLKTKIAKSEFITTPITEQLKEKLALKPLGSLILLENIRFYKEEEANEEDFAKVLSSFADYYVNDAFACIHRKHASIDKIQKFLPSYNGFLMEQETKKLTEFLYNPKKTYAAIIGGSKVSTKLELLKNLTKKANFILIGGAMANSFLKYHGYNVGNSLVEEDYYSELKDLYIVANKNNCKIILPCDFICAQDILSSQYINKDIGDDLGSNIIFDVGEKTIFLFNRILENCSTIVWNGPLGAFEYEFFKNGTLSLAKILSKLSKDKEVIVVAGGGDTISAIDVAGVSQDLSYISTGGGAFLYWLQNT